MNWQEELKKKAEQLNIKEENNGQIISSVNVSNRDSFGGGGDVHSLPIHKEINKVERRNTTMISAEAAKGDIERFIVEAKDVTAIGTATVLILKGLLVLLKVILTTRTNTKQIMVKLGVPLEEKEINKKEETK